MPRKPREKSSTGIYHVTNRGINKLPIFNSNRGKTRFQNLLKKYKEEYDVQIYAYCIMSNHFHLLIKADLEELASFMAKILAAYAIYYNQFHQRKGYVFEGRYKSQCIETESYFWNCLRYIHRNPIKANICKTIDGYKYSSMGEYYKEKSVEIIIDNTTIKMIKEKFNKKEFYEFHKEETDKYMLFIDTPEEVYTQQKTKAEIIFEQMQKDFQMKGEEILDDINVRNLLDNIIKQFLNISLKKAKKIRNEIGNDKRK